MNERKLTVVLRPDPTKATILRTGKGKVFFTGEGDTNLTCGQCSAHLVTGHSPTLKLSNFVFECPECGSCNLSPD